MKGRTGSGRGRTPAGRKAKRGRVADLARERRLRAVDKAISAELAGSPGRAARLRAHLAGELPTAGQDTTLTVRLPATLLERAEALIALMSADPAITAARGGTRGVGLSAVVRLALMEGLPVLEKRYGRR